MEKYYEVTEESRLNKEYFSYVRNTEEVRKLFKAFKEWAGFESDKYYVTSDEIYIVPTENDKEKFKSVLCNPINDGLQKFRTTSKIGKNWVKTLAGAEIQVLRKPMPLLYFSSFGGGRFKSRLFDINGKLYCSIDPCEVEAPGGFVEMKASDFYKIIEESEKQLV